MCYFFSNSLKADVYSSRFGLDNIHGRNLKPFYYVAAFSLPAIPVIANDAPDSLQFLQWGLIPRWVRTSKDADRIRHQTFNLRAETLLVKPAFKHDAQTNRCLIPADGFYEWHTDGKMKYPFYITLNEKEPFAFAGIWDTWVDKSTGEEIKTCGIITTGANPFIAKIHNSKKRMPVILHRKDEAAWLAKKTPPAALERLLRPYEDAAFKAHPISKLITQRGANPDVPAVQKPFEYRELAEARELVKV
jgi:putative SOS response-associated peptidase YedK